MGSSDLDKSSKEDKEGNEPKHLSPQEQTSVASATVAADWSGFQPFSPMPPHGFLASSPQAHPYMWGVQQFIPPYGTPPHPYVAMYPHGGIYPHPTMAPGSYTFSPYAMSSPNGIPEASGNTPGVEIDGKSSEAKGKLPIKRSRGRGSLGSLHMITGKNNESGKTSGATGNGVHSKSADSVSEDTSEGSDANFQNDSQGKSGGRPNSEEPSQNGSSAHSSENGTSNTAKTMVNQTTSIVPMPASGTVSGVPGPTTNLNIGMDYWSAAPSPAVPAMWGKVQASPVAGVIAPTGSRDGMQSQHWVQDEKELKRQRRKQSNRESARRSRLRKQAECEELSQHTDVLKEENASLRAELAHMRNEYEQLLTQNASLKGRLGELPGQQNPKQDDQPSTEDTQ